MRQLQQENFLRTIKPVKRAASLQEVTAAAVLNVTAAVVVWLQREGLGELCWSGKVSWALLQVL
jgi:hypothetical protein